MPISRSDLTKQLIPGLHAIIGQNYKMVEDEHKPLYDIMSSDRSFEEEVLMTDFGEAATKSEGEGVRYDSAQEAWTARYEHETIALAYSMTEEAIEDNLYESLSKRMAAALGRSMASSIQQKAVLPYNNATNTAFPIGDAQPLGSDTHPLLNGGVLDNLSTDDLSETGLENAIIQIGGWTTDRGILVNATAKTLIIPRQLRFTAFKILKSDLSTTTETNSTTGVTNTNKVNALKGGGFFPGGFSVNNRLTDTNGWFIRTDVVDGMKMFVRKPIQVSEDGDFDTGNFRQKARWRGSFGCSDPRGILVSQGSS